ncbi:MAG: efflux RND transporter periplasmic adaptor subunit [Candidatus Sungbacteria bacterium]|nr:efflux RND transporter periplasmic adaptor subunit [Candidatus Sungbacteria bacterium]
MRKLLKLRYILPPAVILIAAGFWYFRGSGEPKIEFVEARRMDIFQEVSVTGKVNPAKTLNLSFEKPGRAVNVPVKVGDRVSPGTLLVALDRASLLAELREVEAVYEIAKIKLDEARRGIRPEEIRIYEVKVASAELAEEDARRNLLSKLDDSFTRADDAVRVKTDQFFINSRSANPELMFRSPNSSLETSIKQERVALEGILNAWSQDVPLYSLGGNLGAYHDEAIQNLQRVRSFLDSAALLLNLLTTTASLTQTAIDGYRTDVSTARTNINTALSNLVSAVEKLRSAQSALAIADQELLLKQAGSTQEQIASAEAETRRVSAQADRLRAELSKSELYSPIIGVVTDLDIDIGEIVAANVPVITLISDAQFEIEANIPEADIAKVKVSSSVKITLDAYGSGIVLEGKVVFIDPAETVIDGVATYKTKIEFLKPDERVRSGMTANLDVFGERRNGVIAVPQRAVFSRVSEKFVRILEADGKTIREQKVETGLRGSDGNIEIVSGLNEGEKVVIFSPID